MIDLRSKDKIIAKIQHFAELIQQLQRDKENLLLTIDRENCEREKLKTQIFICHELLKEYHQIFDDILYR
jgi:Trp operon repressor